MYMYMYICTCACSFDTIQVLQQVMLRMFIMVHVVQICSFHRDIKKFCQVQMILFATEVCAPALDINNLGQVDIHCLD